MRAGYRVRQFWCAITARISARDRQVVAATLPSALAELFYSQSLYDQRHALGVYETLRRAGYDQPALLQAALLHDVGKTTGPLPVLYRVANVLLRAIHPAWTPEPTGWRYPFYVYNQHPARGAALAQAAGAEPAVVALIAAHHEPGCDPLARALRHADEAN